MNILAGKLKSSLYEMFLSETKEERDMIREEVSIIAKENLVQIKKKPFIPINKNQLAGKYPYNNRKNF
ncbi:hypothetical protein MBFIL_05830 [Methanobrevibacter filiformis]|uniref:Uncharacterized protein n=1 Tax=Methanobrevibacter filiformis TaxID=55758 RepID=A0A166DQA6_9EURY|nr:hypothetical protein MBFIL_05830 [Methanobrevibacter filiformis]